MAGGESYTKGTISQVSRSDGVSLDPYYGLTNSFQYAENLNCDDEMHGVKLAQKVSHANVLANCQLISAGDKVFALDLNGGGVKYFTDSNWSSGGTSTGAPSMKPGKGRNAPGVIFQDAIWYGVETGAVGGLVKQQFSDTGIGAYTVFQPKDHNDDSDEAIMDPETITDIPMQSGITALLNYNNTRLVVGVGQDLWIYYPELDVDTETIKGKTGWKKTLHFEDGCVIIGLTCTFEYLKVRVQDEGWNTKVYYYQGNNNLKSTFVYDVIDLTNTKVLRVYSINSMDYYTASLDGTDGYITFNKMIGNVAVMLLKQRAGLTVYDVNNKAPYFVGPTGLDAPYLGGSFYVADSYGIWKFLYDPQSYDKGYMKWKLRGSVGQPTGVAISKNFLYVTDTTGIYKVRLYDTGVDGYQDTGILVSREFEGDYGGSIAKMLDEVRMHYELNPLTTGNGTIDIYVSPNNLRKTTNPVGDGSDGWYHVMHITQDNHNTRYEKTNRLNSLLGPDGTGSPAFGFDRQTITYCIKIQVGTQTQATPIVREVNLKYQLKGKTNNIYGIQNS